MVSPVMKSLCTSAITVLAISISPPQRPSGVACSHPGEHLVRCALGRHDRTGSHGVDQNLIRRQLKRERLTQGDNPSLGHVVRQPAKIARPAAIRHPIRQVHDASSTDATHVGNRCTGAEPGGAKVNRHLPIPVGQVQLIERLFLVDRSHVDQHVEPPELIDGLADDALGRVRLREVRLQHNCATPERAYRVRGVLRLCPRRPVHQRHIRTRTSHFGRHHSADAFSAGDQGHTIA